MAQLSAPRKAGHVLGITLAAIHLASLALPTGSGEEGPPLPVLIGGALIGVAVIILLVQSWRADARGPRRIAAVLLALAGLAALPGLLVADVAPALRLVAGLVVLMTIATIVLLFYPQRQPAIA
jgi:hypothetical protein